MESAEPAEKFASLEAELAAKSSRIAELEARVSLLRAENARLRTAVAKGEAPGLQGEEDPIFGQLVESPGAHKQTDVEKLTVGRGCDVIVLSDDGEGIAVDASKGISPEEGAAAVPVAPKLAMRVVTGESEDVADEVGGSESAKGKACRDSNLLLEDDDVSVMMRGNKRAAAARVVTSDSEDEDRGELGCGKDGQDERASPSRKRALRGIIESDEEHDNEGVHVAGSKRASPLVTPEMDIEDEDDRLPISQVFKKKKFRKERAGDDDELSDANECSTPVTRRSARLVKNQSKKVQAARRVLSFVEPKEYEESDDDMEEDSDMDDFINDGDSSEHASDSAEGSCDETEVSDASAPDEESSLEPMDSNSEINYPDVIASIGRKRKTQDWKFEGEMLAAFDEHPELCLKAVCALYRRQTEEEQRQKATIVHNKEGFSQIDALRASCIAEFLLDGDLYGPLKKSVQDLEVYDRYAFEFCRKVASRYSKQLFAIYQNKEDRYFHP